MRKRNVTWFMRKKESPRNSFDVPRSFIEVYSQTVCLPFKAIIAGCLSAKGEETDKKKPQ